MPCYYGLRPTRTVVRFVLLLHSIVSWFWHAVVTRLLWYNICRNIRTKFGELQEKSMRAQNIRAHVLRMKRAFSCWVGHVFALCTRFQHGFSMDFEAEYRRQKVRHKDFADCPQRFWKYGIRLTVTYFSSSWHHRNPWKINSPFFISSSQTKSGFTVWNSLILLEPRWNSNLIVTGVQVFSYECM